jgi:hypothetical protein
VNEPGRTTLSLAIPVALLVVCIALLCHVVLERGLQVTAQRLTRTVPRRGPRSTEAAQAALLPAVS